MAVNIGPRIGIEGEAEYRRELNNIITQTKTLHAEMRSMESAWGKDTSAKEKAAQQSKALTTAIETQKAEIEKINAAVKESSERYGENDTRTLKWRQALANAETELHNLEAELKKVPNSMQIFGQSMEDAGEKIKKAGEAMSSAGSKLTRTVTAPILAVGTAAVKTTADFDASMSKVAAISGATGNDFTALRKKAREMGETTKYSAAEAADAMTYMAMAGWKTEDMLEGVEGIMYLAAASGEDLATTSDIVTDALTAFGKSAEDSGHLADIMAAASSNANTNVGLMGETFKYVAPVAGSLGLSMEDTAVAIGLMANSGIKGSQAGTTLRNILTRMAKPTKESQQAMDKLGVSLTNSDGSMRSLEDIMQDLREGFSGLTEAEQAEYAAMLAGQRGMSGLLAIVNAAPADYAKLRQAVDNSTGSAKNMATTMQDNLAGQLTILKSQLQELAISFGDILVPTIRKGVEWVQNQATAFSQLDDKTKTQIIKFAALAAAVGPVVSVVGKLTTGVGSLVTTAGKAITLLGGLEGAAIATVAPFAAAAAGVVALGVAANKLYEHYSDADSVMSKTNKTLKDSTEQARSAREAYEKSGKALVNTLSDVESSINSTLATSQLASTLGDELVSLADKTSRTSEEQARMRTLVDQLNVIYPELGLSIDETTGALNKGSTEIKNYISNMSRMSEAQAYQEAYKAIVEEIVQNESDRIQAELELERIEGETNEATRKYADSVALMGTEQGKAGKEANELKNSIKEYSDASENARTKAELFRKKCEELGVNVDGLNDSVDESADAANEASGAFSDYADEVDGASDAVVSAADEIIDAYEKSYEAAKGSLIGQKDLFQELEEAESTSIDAMISGLESHIEASRNYSSNIQTVTSDARYATDENFRAMVNYIIAAGDDMAPALQAIVNALADDDENIERIIDDFGTMSQLDNEIAEETARAATVAEYGLDEVNDALDGGLSEAVDTVSDYQKPLAKASEADGKAVPEKMAAGTEKGKPVLEKALNGLPLKTLNTINAIKGQASAAQSAGNTIPTSAAAGTTAGTPAYNTALDGLPLRTVNHINQIKGQASAARAAGKSTPDNLASGTTAGTPAVQTALSAVSGKFTSTLSTVNSLKGAASSAGQGYVDSAASGLTTGTNTKLRTASDNMVGSFKTGISNVLAMKNSASSAGKTVGDNMGTGHGQAAATVKKNAELVKAAMKDPVYKMIDETRKWGYDTGYNYGAGIESSQTYVKAKAKALAQSVANILKHSTPKEGPLKHDDIWGAHLAQNFASGMVKGQKTVMEAAEGLGYAADMGINRAVVDPAVISGRAGMGATISRVIGGGLDPAAIYNAVREGAAAAETSVVIGEREFMRILRNAGVAMA